MSHWEQKINKIYDTKKTAQENYFSQYSKEKILKFRTKLKEASENAKNEFNMNGMLIDRVSYMFLIYLCLYCF